MSKQIDTRKFDYIRTTAFDKDSAQQKANENLRKLNESRPDNHTVRIDRFNWFTGTAEQVQSLDSTGAPTAIADENLPDETVIALAMDHLKSTAPALNLGDEEPDFIPDPYVKRTSTGICVVTLQQNYSGIPVFQMERTVVLSQNGAIKYVDGSSVCLPSGLEIIPKVALEQAVIAAAEHLAAPDKFINPFTQKPISEPEINLKDYSPRVIARFPRASQSAVVDKDRFGDFIPAYLVFFYQGQQTRLGWHMIIMTDVGLQYVVIVEADSLTRELDKPQVLYCCRTSKFMASVKADVWKHNPGVDNIRQSVTFIPRKVDEYPPSEPARVLPADFPFPWLETGIDITNGLCAICVDGRTDQAFKGALDAAGDLVFTSPADTGSDQTLINAFYFCSFMHDFFFMLGFDEVINFQARHFTRSKGNGGDPVRVRIFNEPVTDLASMTTRADGKESEMLLGIVRAGGVTRHTALDSDVVFHEYTHGVTNRLVGKPLDSIPLQMDQSRALAEGWSDYFALSVQNYFLVQNGKPERPFLQDWLNGTLNDKSIRTHKYDDTFPGRFGMINLPEFSDDHSIGSIWAALLLKINRDIGKELGNPARGHRVGWRIVFDALPKTPSNSSFIQARKAILSSLDEQKGRALNGDEYLRVKETVWKVFAHFGLGAEADSNGATLEKIREDKVLPPGLPTI